MAAAALKHTTIWIAPRSVGERSLVNDPVLQVRLGGRAGQSTALQRCSLEALPPVRSAVLVFDARDVALMRVKLPPLSGARLLRALPNILEDQLLQDPQACSFVPGPVQGDGERLVAVIDRAWFEFVIGALERRGVRVLAAWPGQLAQPIEPGCWSLSCLNQSLALRLSPTEGLGWFAGAEPGERTEALSALFETAVSMMPKPMLLHVRIDDPAWQPCVEAAASQAGLAVDFHELAPDFAGPIDLLAARQGSAGRRWLAGVDWRAWQIPALLAGATAAVAVMGLNLHWAQLARERTELRQAMEAGFRQAFPKAQVVVDPLLQMRRQTAEWRLRAGQDGPDDFLPLLLRFTRLMGPGASDALAALDYRDGRLKVRWRAGALDPARRESLRLACQRAGLRLEYEGDTQALVSVAG